MPAAQGPSIAGDQRHDAGHLHLLAEEVARAGEQRARRLLDPGAGRVEQPDQRHPLSQRDLAQAGHLELAGHPHRAGHHREVVGGDRARAAVDVAPAGDDAVGGSLLALHRPLREVRAAVDAHLDERALVDQQVDPLAGRELAALVLLGDLLLAAAQLRLLAPLVEVLGRARTSSVWGLGARAGLGRVAHFPFHSGSRFSKNAMTPSIASSVPSSIVSCELR